MKAIVFDFDGVLMRSMELHAKAYREVLAPYVDVQESEVFALEGARSETIIQDLLRPIGKSLDPEALARMSEAKQEAFRNAGTPKPYTGTAALLDWALQYPCALVTGTRRVNVDQLLPQAPRFASLVCQEDYSKDKPDPEPYARAAEALGFEPSDCVAVENAVRGIQSARAAGYGKVVGITTTMPKEALLAAGADAIVGDQTDIPQLIGAWLKA